MLQFRDELKQLNPYVPGKPIEDVKREYGLKSVVKLASNENPYGMSPKAKQAVIDSLDEDSLYPDGNCTDLRNALAKFYNVPAGKFIFGCGTDEIISMIGKVLINKDDECITADVSFSQYAASALSMGGKMVYAPMKEHGFNLKAISDKITGKTKVIFIANPNNPTGTIHTQAEQEAFMEKVPSNILVAFDEAYGEFVYDGNYPNTLEMMDKYKNIIYLKTFSKAYGLAGLRVGYGIAGESIIAQFEKVRNPFNVPATAQVAAIAALADREFLNHAVNGNRLVKEYVCGQFEEMGLFYIPTHANFIMVDVKKDSRKVFTDLMKAGYIIRPGAAFGMDTFLRVTLGTMDEMKGFIDVLRELLN